MKSRNIYNKIFIILAAIIIPLMITIGLAAWIMISEERIKPKYNPDSAFYVYLNKQETTYTGSPQLPSNPNITIDSSVTYKYREVGETNYTNGAPTNAGEYYINFSSSKDKTEGGYPSSDVYFKINKATPTVSSWPTLSAIYWGNTPSFSGGDTTNGSFSIVDGTLAFKSGGSRTSAELPYTVSLLYTPTDTTNYNTLTQTADVKLKAVANVGSTFYATVDEAITSTTSGTIYVMITEAGSDKAKTIGATTTKTSITLASGVTLYIPYRMSNTDGTYTYNAVDSNREETSKDWGANFMVNDGRSNFADCSTDSMAEFLKNTVYIETGKEFILASTTSKLVVSGILGVANSGTLQGHTSRDYAEIRMKPNSKITNNGVITLGGYIKEVNAELNYVNSYTAEVRSKPGSFIYMPYVINDNRGGPSTIGAYGVKYGDTLNGLGFMANLASINENIMPLSRMDFPNIQTSFIIESGAVVEGYVDIFTNAVANIISAQHNSATATIFSKVGLSTATIPVFTLNEGAYVKIECVNKTPGLTKHENFSRRTYLEVNKKSGIGGISFKSLEIDITVLGKTVTLESAKVYMALSNLMEFNLVNGESYIEESFKLLPGASIIVHKGATLTVSGNLTAYTEFNDNCEDIPYPSSDLNAQNGLTSYGELVVNGKLIVESGASIGGIIRTESENAELHLEEGAIFSITTEEGWGGMDDSYNFQFYRAIESPITERCKLYIYAGDSVQTTPTTINAHGVYYSKQDPNNENSFGWYSKDAYIYYDANGGTLTGADQTGSHTTGAKGHLIQLDLVNQSIPTREHYTFAGWALTPEGDDLIIQYKDSTFSIYKEHYIFTNTTLYAKWIPIDYTINYVYIWRDDAPNEGTINTTNLLSTFNAEYKGVSLIKPTHSNGYVFDGWYLDEALTQPLATINGSDYVSSGSLTLYGTWLPKGTKTYTIEYILVNNSGQEIEMTFSQTDSIVTYNASKYQYPADYTSLNDNTTIPYYFVGWYVNDTSGERLFNPSVDLSTNSTVIEERTITVNGEEVTDYYIEVYYKFDKKAKVTTIDYRPSISDTNATLATRDSIYIIPGTYNPSDLVNSSIANIKNAFVTKTNFGGDNNYQFYGYGTSKTKQSLTSLTFSNAVENNNVYLHYLLLVEVTVSSSVELGKAGYTSESNWYLDSNVYFYIGTDSDVIGTKGDNDKDYGPNVYTVVEGTSYSVTVNITKTYKYWAFGTQTDTQSISITNGTGTIGTNATQTINITIK